MPETKPARIREPNGHVEADLVEHAEACDRIAERLEDARARRDRAIIDAIDSGVSRRRAAALCGLHPSWITRIMGH